MNSWKEHFLWLLRCIQSKEKKNSLSAARLSLPPGHLKCALPLPSFLWYGLRVEGEAPQVTRAGSLDWRASLSERRMCHWSHPTVTYRQARQAGRVWQTTTKSLHENALRHLFLCSYYNPVERKFHSQSGNLRGLLLPFRFQSSLSWWITFDFEMKHFPMCGLKMLKTLKMYFVKLLTVTGGFLLLFQTYPLVTVHIFVRSFHWFGENTTQYIIFSHQPQVSSVWLSLCSMELNSDHIKCL